MRSSLTFNALFVVRGKGHNNDSEELMWKTLSIFLVSMAMAMHFTLNYKAPGKKEILYDKASNQFIVGLSVNWKSEMMQKIFEITV